MGTEVSTVALAAGHHPQGFSPLVPEARADSAWVEGSGDPE